MKLEFVGCGAGFSVGLGNNNVMLYEEKPEDGFHLIDCGESTRLELVRRGILDKLCGVIITHLHGDHIYGLEMIGFWWYFVKKQKLNLYLPSDEMVYELWSVLAPTMRNIQDSEGNPIEASIHSYFNICTTEHLVFKAKESRDQLVVSFVRNSHVPCKESYSVSFQANDNRHLFTSDQRSVTVSEDYATIWHDAQMYDGGKGGVHAYYRDVINSSGVKKSDVWLMHYNRVPTAEELREVEASGCKGFVQPGQVFEL